MHWRLYRFVSNASCVCFACRADNDTRGAIVCTGNLTAAIQFVLWLGALRLQRTVEGV